eukprot:XP_001391173.2 hypothetical protein ANI_1_1438064 [Aspergillus niger CBS 513.88]
MQRKLELVDFTCFYEFCTYLLGAAGALLESDVVKTRPNNTRAYKEEWSWKDLVLTIWLFTADDFTTFVIPETAFGICAALSGPLLTDDNTPDLLSVVSRIPIVMLWNWLNLFVFNLANQRHPDSVAEDKINRPWRPLPAGRISILQTRRLLLLAIPMVLASSVYLGAWEETALLYTLNWVYNDLSGGDDGFILRNVLLALAFSQYNKGSLRVATGTGFDILPRAWRWIWVTSAVIGTTMHIQDIKDVEGDRAKNRRTMPIVMGDGPARWSVAVPVAIWSVVCPAFWELDVASRALKDGRFKGHPFEVRENGLEGVKGAMKDLMDGKASAVKYVFRIAETPGL